jgi:hypothetical protein
MSEFLFDSCNYYFEIANCHAHGNHTGPVFKYLAKAGCT